MANDGTGRLGVADHRVKWRDFVDRHAGGSFGAYGEYTDVPVTDSELWTLSEQPIVVANRAAIGSRSGAVRSRFVLTDVGHMCVDVLTVLSPARGPRTLMKTVCVGAG
jgi:hypothetical protein